MIQFRQAELDNLYRQYAPCVLLPLAAPPCPPPDIADHTKEDHDLAFLIACSGQGAKYQKLYAGEWSNDYGSQSEADLALANILAYWSGKDSGQIDRMFRRSALYRNKWDRRHGRATYGQLTIEKAIAGTGATAPPVPVPPADWFAQALAGASVGRLIDNAPPPLDWVFDDSLLAGTVGALVGAGGTGKSTLALLLLISIATGLEVLPGVFHPTRAGRVVAVFAEEDSVILHHRFKSLVSGLFPFEADTGHQALRQNMSIIPAAGRDLRLLTGDNPTPFFNNLLESVKNIPDLRLIVIDPLSRFFGAVENDNQAGTLFVSLLEQLAQATGAAIVICHHTGKKTAFVAGKFDLDSALHQDSARGATALTNAFRWQCNLVGLPDKEARRIVCVRDAIPGQFLALQVSKKNYGKPEPIHFLQRLPGGVLKPFKLISHTDPELDSVILKLIVEKVNESNQSGMYLTQKAVKDTCPAAWKTIDNRITKSEVARILTVSILDNHIHERADINKSGRKTFYLFTEKYRTGKVPAEPAEPDSAPRPVLLSNNTN